MKTSFKNNLTKIREIREIRVQLITQTLFEEQAESGK